MVFIKFFYLLNFWHIKQVDVPSNVILEYLLDATPDFRLKRTSRRESGLLLLASGLVVGNFSSRFGVSRLQNRSNESLEIVIWTPGRARRCVAFAPDLPMTWNTLPGLRGRATIYTSDYSSPPDTFSTTKFSQVIKIRR